MAGELTAFMYVLEDGAGEEYDARHAQVWPEIVELMRGAGVEWYRLWRRDALVVGLMSSREPFHTTHDFLATHPVQVAWSGTMAHLFRETTDADGAPLVLREVFDLAHP
ncbi:L-rhamnose mutarotase [Georgenia faecalis]|uniref:L-rhamnose mutarotase n=1 Tax=Georgenia faecalis TaxID=2483799 RepID=UPI000FDAE7BC|nr:L-rhamnose mutarotase [Georgenia faecalis]